MKNENFDKVLDRLISSTRSPRGCFSAEESWKLLKQRMQRKRMLRRLRLRVASTAATILLGVASWAAYQWMSPAPRQAVIPTKVAAEASTPIRRDTLTFHQIPLQEIARQLSETFQTEIRVEGDSLQQYRMTATFRQEETLTEILDLLQTAGHFTSKQINDTIILTTKLN